MKNIILITFCSFLTLVGYAQDNNDAANSNDTAPERMQTFKSSKNGTHGVYIGLGGGYANYGGLDYATVNGRIAYVIDQKFEIGFAGQTFNSFTEISIDSETQEIIGGGVGGLHFKGIYFGRKRVHLSTPLFIGVGAVALLSHSSDNIFDDFDPDLVRASPLFVAEPGVNVEFNISKVLGFEVGAKYRFSHQTSLVANQIDNMNGLMLGATLKVGFFDFGGKNKKERNQEQEMIEAEAEGYKSY